MTADTIPVYGWCFDIEDHEIYIFVHERGVLSCDVYLPNAFHDAGHIPAGTWEEALKLAGELTDWHTAYGVPDGPRVFEVIGADADRLRDRKAASVAFGWVFGWKQAPEISG